jgi:hypothetical protein
MSKYFRPLTSHSYEPIVGGMAVKINKAVHINIPGLWKAHRDKVKHVLESHLGKLKSVMHSYDRSLPHHLDGQTANIATVRKLIFSQIDQALNAFRQNVDVLGAAHDHVSGVLQTCFEFMAKEITGKIMCCVCRNQCTKAPKDPHHINAVVNMQRRSSIDTWPLDLAVRSKP